MLVWDVAADVKRGIEEAIERRRAAREPSTVDENGGVGSTDPSEPAASSVDDQTESPVNVESVELVSPKGTAHEIMPEESAVAPNATTKGSQNRRKGE